MMPVAIGVAAEVPLKSVAHLPSRSIVACNNTTTHLEHTPPTSFKTFLNRLLKHIKKRLRLHVSTVLLCQVKSIKPLPTSKLS